MNIEKKTFAAAAKTKTSLADLVRATPAQRVSDMLLMSEVAEEREADNVDANPPDGYATALAAKAATKPRAKIKSARQYDPFGEPLDGYAMALSALGGSSGATAFDATGQPFGTPPDGYAIALAARKETAR